MNEWKLDESTVGGMYVDKDAYGIHIVSWYEDAEGYESFRLLVPIEKIVEIIAMLERIQNEQNVDMAVGDTTH